MAIDLSKETLGFVAYYGYSKISNVNWTDEEQLANWRRVGLDEWRENWNSSAREAIEENDRRRAEERAAQSEPFPKASVDILAITRACAT